MDYRIREIGQEEYAILDEFLYKAIFIPDGVEAPLKSIIRQPELQVYVSDFGKKCLRCLGKEGIKRYLYLCRKKIMPIDYI